MTKVILAILKSLSNMSLINLELFSNKKLIKFNEMPILSILFLYNSYFKKKIYTQVKVINGFIVLKWSFNGGSNLNWYSKLQVWINTISKVLKYNWFFLLILLMFTLITSLLHELWDLVFSPQAFKSVWLVFEHSFFYLIDLWALNFVF